MATRTSRPTPKNRRMRFAPLLAITGLLFGGCQPRPPSLATKPPTPIQAAVPKARAKSLSVLVLAWDASPSSDVAGYRVYQGAQSGLYTNSVDVGPLLTATINPAPGTNFIAATAYATNGLESVFSNEILYVAPPVYPPRLLVTAQSAPTPDGPWLSFTNWVTPNTGSNLFFRLTITPAP